LHHERRKSRAYRQSRPQGARDRRRPYSILWARTVRWPGAGESYIEVTGTYGLERHRELAWNTAVRLSWGGL
jgi:hypothetical protein